MPTKHKIIAVYGNSGSYKTSVSVNLANAIVEKDNTADVVVVGLDSTKPLTPLLFPRTKSKTSLGKLLSTENFDQETILCQIQSDKRVGIIGYNTGENYNTYAFPIDSRIDDFLMQMRHLSNYTIVDCTSDVVANKLTAKTLINADEVIYLISCDINGLVFYNSQEPILISEQYDYNSYKKYLTVNNRFIPDIEVMKNCIPQIMGVIPYSDKITEQWNEGNGLQNVSDTKYNATINEIANNLMEGD